MRVCAVVGIQNPRLSAMGLNDRADSFQSQRSRRLPPAIHSSLLHTYAINAHPNIPTLGGGYATRRAAVEMATADRRAQRPTKHCDRIVSETAHSFAAAAAAVDCIAVGMCVTVVRGDCRHLHPKLNWYIFIRRTRSHIQTHAIPLKGK